MEQKYDIAIIGGGPGGYVAAIRAAQLNKKIVLIEKEHLGGVCLNYGCIPTKALLKSAEVYEMISHADKYGIKVKDISLDIHKIVERSRKIAAQLSQGIGFLLQKNKINVINGFGFIQAPNKILVESSKNEQKALITADKIIIATGASAKSLQNFKIDGDFIWSYKEAMMPKFLPKSLIIVGAGAIGIEFASFYNALGTHVTLIESKNHILPNEDEEISIAAQKIFTAKGIKILTNVKLERLKRNQNSVELVVTDKSNKEIYLNSDRMIMAVGVKPNIEDIGIENTNVQTSDGQISVSEYMQTSEKSIYAIGDVVSSPWLAHKASHEGIIAVEHICGLNPHPLKKDSIPGCIYSNPQVASVGLTETKAKDLGHEIRVGKFPFNANGKAVAISETQGFVKTIFDSKTGELLGAHMIGDNVTELIHGYVIAKNLETTEQELMHTVFPHPTLSEMLHESVLHAYNKPIHIFKDV